MLVKKIALYHVLPALTAALLGFAFMKACPVKEPDLQFSAQEARHCSYILNFKTYDLSSQVAFSAALKQRVPVLMGSSELTSGHLPALAQNFFNQDKSRDRFLSIGHAGFQSLGILTVLAANRELLKGSKLTIILSPGWFEEQYCKGISLSSFFEYASPNYMYKIQQDKDLDTETKKHIASYLSAHFDQISKPDASLRLMGKKQGTLLNQAANAPFNFLNNRVLKQNIEKDLYLGSQQHIVQTLLSAGSEPYLFYKRQVNWDSLMKEAEKKFKTISTNNSIAVENGYYDTWLKGKRKKRVVAVAKENNQEFKDLEALVRFLKQENCEPLFVIMPLNTRAHENLSVLQPTIDDIQSLLHTNGFKSLDMFSPNLTHYQDGVLEDIMHPYDLGWYQIDKFISDNYHDGN